MSLSREEQKKMDEWRIQEDARQRARRVEAAMQAEAARHMQRRKLITLLAAAAAVWLSFGSNPPAHADTYGWSYSGQNNTLPIPDDNGLGMLTTSGTCGTGLCITSISGTWAGTATGSSLTFDPISGLLAPGTFNSNDNALFPLGPGFLDQNGMAFLIDGNFVDIFCFVPCRIGDPYFATTLKDDTKSTTDGTFTLALLSVAPVPFPYALLLFVTGLGVLGLLGWRVRRGQRTTWTARPHGEAVEARTDAGRGASSSGFCPEGQRLWMASPSAEALLDREHPARRLSPKDFRGGFLS